MSNVPARIASMKFMQRKTEESIVDKLAREREKEEREAKWKVKKRSVLANPSKLFEKDATITSLKEQRESKSVETVEDTDDRPTVFTAGRRSFGNFNAQIERLTRKVKAEQAIVAKIFENESITDEDLAVALGTSWNPKEVVERERAEELAAKRERESKRNANNKGGPGIGSKRSSGSHISKSNSKKVNH